MNLEMEDVSYGLPSALLMPVGRYKLKKMVGLATISVPTRGPFPANEQFVGDYDISPASGVILFGVLLQVLLASGKYPRLDKNQRFVLSGVEVNGDEVSVVGRVVEFLEE